MDVHDDMPSPTRERNPQTYVDRIATDWGWFSDPLLAIPKQISDRVAKLQAIKAGKRETADG